jgi:hypothetical protein
MSAFPHAAKRKCDMFSSLYPPGHQNSKLTIQKVQIEKVVLEAVLAHHHQKSFFNEVSHRCTFWGKKVPKTDFQVLSNICVSYHCGVDGKYVLEKTVRDTCDTN